MEVCKGASTLVFALVNMCRAVRQPVEVCKSVLVHLSLL